MVSSSGRQPNFAALNRGHHGHHLCSAARPSLWALAHILVFVSILFTCLYKYVFCLSMLPEMVNKVGACRNCLPIFHSDDQTALADAERSLGSFVNLLRLPALHNTSAHNEELTKYCFAFFQSIRRCSRSPASG